MWGMHVKGGGSVYCVHPQKDPGKYGVFLEKPEN
jgi:hypothetical protein